MLFAVQSSEATQSDVGREQRITPLLSLFPSLVPIPLSLIFLSQSLSYLPSVFLHSVMSVIFQSNGAARLLFSTILSLIVIN